MVYQKFNQVFSFSMVFFIALLSFLSSLHAEEKNSIPKVVVTIKPLHSLVSGLMKGVGEPKLLLKGASSPHHFQLKPSDALAIKRADLIVRVGPLLETPMNKVLGTLSSANSVLNVMELEGIKLYKLRSKHHHHEDEGHGDHKEKHAKHDDHDDHDDHKEKHAKHDDHDDHDDHKEKHAKHDDHDDHDDHKEKHAKHDDHDDHDDHKEKHAKHDDHDDHDDHKEKHAKHDDHDDHDDHKEKHAKHDDHDDHGAEKDPHIWLDTGNAKIVVFALAKRLTKIDPKNSKLYQQNAITLSSDIDKLSLETTALLKPLNKRSYMVFHDAYQYLTEPHHLTFSGAITLNPATPPSAKHLKELIQTLDKEKVVCVFSEVQYNPKLIKTLSDGHDIKTAVLDPIGANIQAGSSAYFIMMKRLTQEIHKCLKP